jgi:hypothetical protein
MSAYYIAAFHYEGVVLFAMRILTSKLVPCLLELLKQSVG